jgi:hypothetical protein
MIPTSTFWPRMADTTLATRRMITKGLRNKDSSSTAKAPRRPGVGSFRPYLASCSAASCDESPARLDISGGTLSVCVESIAGFRYCLLTAGPCLGVRHAVQHWAEQTKKRLESSKGLASRQAWPAETSTSINMHMLNPPSHGPSKPFTNGGMFVAGISFDMVFVSRSLA